MRPFILTFVLLIALLVLAESCDSPSAVGSARIGAADGVPVARFAATAPDGTYTSR